MHQALPGVLLLLLSLGGVAVVPAIWRGSSPFLDDDGTASLGWFWGERMVHGLRRGILACDIACLGLAIALLALGARDGEAGAVAWAASVVALLGLLLLVAIVLLNQPKWLVPPSLRAEPGALSRRSGPRRAG